MFQTSTYSEDKKRPRSRDINKKVIGLMKDELGWKIMIELVAIRPKPYSSLMDDDNGVKKAKETKKCLGNWRLIYTNYKGCSLKNKIKLKSQQRFKSEAHSVYTEEINKIVLSSNDDKISHILIWDKCF